MTKEIYLNEILNATHCETIEAVIHIAIVDPEIVNEVFRDEILETGRKRENEIIDKILDDIKSIPRPWEGTEE